MSGARGAWLSPLLAAAGIAAAAAAELTPSGSVVLPVPHAAGENEAIWLELEIGALPKGEEIEVLSSTGALLGTISPFGALRAGAAPARYTIPLPKSALTAGSVDLRLEVEAPGAAPRPPRPGEVRSIKLIYVPTAK